MGERNIPPDYYGRVSRLSVGRLPVTIERTLVLALDFS